MHGRSLRSPSRLSETVFEDLGYNLRHKLGEYIEPVKSKTLKEIKPTSASWLRSERTKV